MHPTTSGSGIKAALPASGLISSDVLRAFRAILQSAFGRTFGAPKARGR